MRKVLDSVVGRFWLWTAAMLGLLLIFALRVQPSMRIDTDIQTMLPGKTRDPAIDRALTQYSDAVSRKTVFLVGGPDPAAAKNAASQFADFLRSSKAFDRIQLEFDAKALLGMDLYKKYRFGLLSEKHRAWLQRGETRQFGREALRAIYNPAPLIRPLSVAGDPFNLLGDFVSQQWSMRGAARPDGSVLMVSDAQMSYALVIADTADSPFSTATDDQLLPVIRSATARAETVPGIEVLGSGVLLHASAAAQNARHDINMVGALSMTGILLMMLLTFRSLWPVAMSASILGMGAVAAMTACHYVFGRIHLFALVFGSGLIGVAIDYSTHFLADQFRDPENWTPTQALPHVGPSIAMGMACAVLGYLGLMLAPLPGLQEMAVFSAVGLVVACFSVLCWYPLLARRMRKPRPPLLLRGSDAMDDVMGKIRAWRFFPAVGMLLVCVSLLGLLRVHFADDVRLLQPSSPQLLESERRVARLLKNPLDSRFFLVRAATPQSVLQTEEMLHGKLDALVEKKALASYNDISRALPSPQRQSENRQLLKQTVYAPGGLASTLMKQLGLPPNLIRRRLAEFASAPRESLELDEWLSNPVSEPYRHLWLGRTGGSYASIVSLAGVNDVSAVAALDGALPGVRFVDKINDVSEFLGRYRNLAAALIALAYGLIGVLMAWRYSARTALSLLAVPVSAAVVTLAFLGVSGFGASLFNVLGLFIVLGLGVDYAVFLRESRHARRSTVLAISLSTIGTVLSYGLLALSHIPFIRSLGLTLLIGITLTYAFALISQRPLRA